MGGYGRRRWLCLVVLSHGFFVCSWARNPGMLRQWRSRRFYRSRLPRPLIPGLHTVWFEFVRLSCSEGASLRVNQQPGLSMQPQRVGLDSMWIRNSVKDEF
ncbi:hypothetical protein BU23DRAFT_98558 [Bimuria novae-zelandiae CBS 107.79]|uniref:Secreted protein n=1 Tax=Bimuria novae-zelandiae CBS 107.79 TaxID=1447943 RepID=A0A6A5VSB1_9PLEO|nr:hypothetical protein BU23DRAFT_98558 [Bimuria novae-zelandiae CBS 107.79]